MRTFYEFGLDHEITRALDNMGFEEATPIQEQAIPIAMTGKDIIGQAQTGTGKTVAFGIPLMEKITKDTEHVQGIVITPTRELAMQVAEELYKLGQFKGVRTLPIYGGQDISRQIRSLKKKPQIIVGTPGRLLDHLRRKTLRLQNISTVVLDEADEMLNMGFIEDIEAILAEVPEEKQVLLFSATMPKRIELLAQKFMNSPELVKTKAKEMTVPNIEQNYMEVKEKDKFDVLTRLLDIENPELSIIFGRTKRRVDELSEALNKRGYLAEGIHGDLSQAIRNKVLKKFKDKSVDILVATDVAARGLDINDVTHIFNFDIPQDPEGYVHRIGRTGRAGKTGMALTFVTPREIDHLKVIENITKKKMTKKPIPSMIDAMEGQKQLTVEKILGMIKEGNINQYKGLAEDLLEQYDSVTLLSAALKMLTKEPDTTPINLTEESPLRMKKNNQKPKGRRAFDKGRSHNKDKSFDKGKKRNDKRRPRKKQKAANSK